MALMYSGLRGYCPHCELMTSFRQAQRVRVWPTFAHYSTNIEGGSQPVVRYPSEGVDIWVLTCEHCWQGLTLLDRFVAREDGRKKHVVSRQVVYPEQTPRSLPSEVPDGVRDLFEEASKCENAGALRGAAVLYRAAVEEIVREQGGSGGNLEAKIDSLSDGPAAAVVDDMHEARLLGNSSIHQGVRYAPEEVEDVALLIQEACHLLYVQPAQRQAMKESREKRRAAAKLAAKQVNEPASPDA